MPAIEGKSAAVVGETFGFEECLEFVAQVPFAGILSPPGPVDGPVARGAKGVETEVGGVGVPGGGDGRAVEV